ncbi:helix-turn-helix domain-containing protein [Streptomyces sp. NPDC001770]
MPRSNNDRNPLRYVREGTWPEVLLTPEAPISAHCGLLLARNMEQVMAEEHISRRHLAEVAAVAHSTVFRVLSGDVLPDIGTLARIEHALHRQVWPALEAVRASIENACP